MKLFIKDTEYDTEIWLDETLVHEGSGEHTRNAMRNLSESFAFVMGWEVVWDDETGEDDV